MEQLRHRLTNVGPQGQRCSIDQNPLKRSDLDDLESPAAPSPALRVACYNPKNRHDRKESQRIKSLTYAELTKRDPQRSELQRRACHRNFNSVTTSLPLGRPLALSV